MSDHNPTYLSDPPPDTLAPKRVNSHVPSATLTKTLEELLDRDRQREEDGFPRKIRIGRLVKPGKGLKGKIIIVPGTVEEKFYHDSTVQAPDEGRPSGGTGDEEVGEVIGEQPVREEEGGAGAGPGGGGEEGHEMEASAYDLGKILSETFKLPNLKDKGKKNRSLTRVSYDLTDRNRGVGQILDKKATMRRILETNIALGNVPDIDDIDPTKFLIAPRDKVYRVFSPEKEYEPQAMLFFLRDYSGSMAGRTTELIVSQHVLIYSWLLYQYAGQAEVRFILHDTEAKEVPDFYTYHNSGVAGGTQVHSAYHLVNQIVEKESLINDYNIYVFHGTDGDDWDTTGEKAIPELKQMLEYTGRVGITIAESRKDGLTDVGRYLDASGLLKDKPDLIRLDVFKDDADESRLIEGIRKLMS